jgi:hypothetical protein
MTTIVSALLLCLRGLSTPPRPLRVDIAIESASTAPAFVAGAIEEAAGIWAAYDVEIRVPAESDAAHRDALRLVVKLVPSPGKRTASGALGSIAFSGDGPEPAIELYPSNASALIAAVAFNRREDTWPAASRDSVMARVLGRALAHEVGHFLLRSRSHSTNGLMKAEQIAPDLMAPNHGGFTLSADEVRRFHAILSPSVEPPQ